MVVGVVGGAVWGVVGDGLRGVLAATWAGRARSTCVGGRCRTQPRHGFQASRPAQHVDLHQFRAERQRKTDNLLKEDHRDIKRFFALDSAAYRDLDGGLDGKTKELLGLVASTVLRCNDCIAYHCDQAVAAGWTRGEILDALNVALVVGGSITIPHIRTVWEVVDQLFAEQEAAATAPAAKAKPPGGQ